MCVRLPLLLLLALFPGSAATAAEPVSSVAWVRGENDAAGAGFIIDSTRKWLVTCRHVVVDRQTVDCFFPDTRDNKPVTDRSVYLGDRAGLRRRGLLVTGRVIRRSDAADLALVELPSLPPTAVGLTLAQAPTRSGEPVRVIGHRLDLDTLWNLTAGPIRVSGKLTEGYPWHGQTLAAGAEVLIGQLPIEEGDSGGPVLNSRGEVVGMAAALRRQVPSAAVVISTHELRRFLDIQQPAPVVLTPSIADHLTAGTVWVRPTATDRHSAGTIIDRDRGLILTSSRGLVGVDRVGVAFPVRDGGRWLTDRALYGDSVGLCLRGGWRVGLVLAVDPTRDLALIRVVTLPAACRSLTLSPAPPASGGSVHTLSHPAGLEFAWVYAAGVVRQTGTVALADGESAPRISVAIYQLPAQSRSAGGPIVDDQLRLLGVVSSRESAQQVAYAAAPDEIAHFLDTAPGSGLAARTLAGLLAAGEDLGERVRRAAALHYANRGDLDRALTLDPALPQAHLLRLARADSLGMTVADVADAAATARFDRDLLLRRAQIAIGRSEWRKARGLLESILDVDPLDAPVRRLLVGVLLGLHEEPAAAAAVGDTVRADAKHLGPMLADLLAQADAMARAFPDTPSRPVSWLRPALISIQRATADAPLGAVLERADQAHTDRDRLAILRDFLTQPR